jgi:plastocyanin
MKKIILMLLLIGVIFISGCIGQNQQNVQQTQTSQPKVAKENIVLVDHNSFTPRQITIIKGETITWKNTASFQGLPYDRHTITSGSIDAACSQGKQGVIQNTECGVADEKFSGSADGGTFSFTFDQEGTYTYYIAEHPALAGLGTVAVSSNQQSGVKEFRLEAPHAGYTFYFENRPVLKVSVNKGDKVKILATSDLLSHKHGITIDEYGLNEVIPTEDPDNPKIIEFTADKAGTFKIYCKTCLTGAFGPHPWMESILEVK